jgi:hypothetical protein
VWKWFKDGMFSVKSVYKQLCGNGIDMYFKHFRKSKIPLKIKVHLWLIWHNAIAAKDNMIKQKWVGNTKCQFCNEEEMIHHIFFTCSALKYISSRVSRTIGPTNRIASFSQFSSGSLVSPCQPQHPDDQIAGIADIC